MCTLVPYKWEFPRVVNKPNIDRKNQFLKKYSLLILRKM